MGTPNIKRETDMYKKVSTDLDFCSREQEVIEFWKDNDVFKASCAKNAGKAEFSFYDGPPTANGKPHIGHILTRCIKDLIPRYKTMQGYNVLRIAGWDTHGLPVELEVEKTLGLDGKEQIEEYGVMPFIEKCKESVWKYKSEWEKMSERVGYWADMENPYVTYKDEYIESEWWSLKKLFEKGLIYKGYKIVPYCPRCGTALSSHEVAQGYKDVKETSIFVKFRVSGEDAYMLAWTTTPWTLPSNVALCVNADETYALVESRGEKIYMAKELVSSVLGEEAKILSEMKGKDLEYKEYEPLWKYDLDGKKGHYVVCDSYVTLTDGSGIVHIAPAFGEDDSRVGKNYDLPFVQMVDGRGRMKEETSWAGVFVKDADKLIIEELKERGLLFAELPYEHSYPFCWRCDTPLIYYARSSWFISMTKVRDELVKNTKSVNWMPESIRDGRMGNFVENVIDWGISRERYWGTPLPIWVCDKCGHIHVIGSRKELSELTGAPEDIELHKPFIDPLTFKCDKCGGTMKRVPEVMDCWYDSGSMPFAQWHYPFEHEEEFKGHFPAQFISEAVDQTRGWFYTLLAISTLLFNKAPFENCIVLGHVQDKDGQKMSKHKGNVVDPWSVLDKQGADAVRWYFYSSSAPWLPSRFYDDAVSESQRKFMGTLWNTYAFYILYAEIDKFDPTGYELKPENIMDRWILSKVNSLVKSVTEHLDNYRIFEPARELIDFVDELSNWYVRLDRERFWGSENTKDKMDAFMTLYTVLETLTRLIAPFVPFMSESIYQNIVRSVDAAAPISVHLCDYPVADASLIDSELEVNMDAVKDVVALGRACRNVANIKTRQPISEVFVSGISHLGGIYTDLIKSELNVKEVSLGAAAEEFISYRIKPQLRTLGPKYGKMLGAIREHLASADGIKIVNAVKNGGTYSFDANGNRIDLTEEDLLVEPVQKEGFMVETSDKYAVVIDTVLTDSLIEEGFVREIISKMQTMRKEAGFEVTDHITVAFSGNDKIADVVSANKAQIMSELLCEEISGRTDDGFAKELNINGEKVMASVKKVG